MKPIKTIDRVEASAYSVPTERPETDGTFAWEESTLVLVQVWAGDELGTGWTYGSMGTAALIRQTLGPMLVGRRVADIARLWADMVIALRNIGRPGIGSMALSAVDCALWDLKARLVELPLHHLIGAYRSAVPVYASGGFVNQDDQQLTDQLRGWTDKLGLSRVKIKIGEDWGRRPDRDLDRLRLARDVVGPGVELYVAANGAYHVGQATRICRDLDDLDVRWFEEPVSSDDLAGLRQVRTRCRADVVAGSYGYDLGYFRRVCAADALDCLQVDLTRCGGITELLRIAAVAAAHNLDVSGQGAPYLSAPALAAVPNLRHTEWFHDHVRVEQLLFAGTADPVDGVLPLADDVDGHGLTWREEVASPYRVF
ncbi:L-alanine-DL-glutamate epimerase-like enolase superfamily enzyme [Friedmanniella endophytica]|uniref:L-alanine-DL-glutamate epimerase-like enolase superfamily enzyme n=1 Tax=Microlunatus kandeliicorticis TaxID=1759536 RepID=A0A7W3IRF8_9ACTN|nr:enolase C-terminal domain-like protein [Microlunatus kandeliicorticis]MBA8793883.1 L-alanine-DL-glutamate epimerase-like enolase superfamily enzyme [Microlunatus kandeliicorticis]